MVIPLEEKISALNQRLKKMKDEKRYFYLKSIDGASGARVTIDGRKMIMFASYNYLGLITHPKIKKAAIDAIEKYSDFTENFTIGNSYFSILLMFPAPCAAGERFPWLSGMSPQLFGGMNSFDASASFSASSCAGFPFTCRGNSIIFVISSKIIIFCVFIVSVFWVKV